MKRFFTAALICAVFFSCKTPSFGGRDEGLPPAVTEPAAGETDAPAVEEEEPDAGTGDAEEPAPEEETPFVEDFAEAPAERSVEEPAELPDPPSLDFPRVITFLDPPPEEVTDMDYPEPEPPNLPPPPELSQVPEDSSGPPAPKSEPAPVEEPPPVSGTTPLSEPAPLPEESPPPPAAPPVPPPPPPAPPPLVRPAESAGARPSPRETLPVPVNPVPEPPARRPPVTVRPAPPEPGPSVQPSAPPPAVPERTGPAISPVPASPETQDTLSYSRTIRGTTGQVLEVPFRGTGWVYLGETNAGRGISYLSRRAEPEGQTFVFRLDESGEYELKFYKQDFIRDYILNDHVRVIVEDAPERDSFSYSEEPVRLVAEPRWPPPENPAGRTDSAEVPPPTDPRDRQSPKTTAAGQGSAAPGTTPAGQSSAAPGTAAAGQGSAAPGTTPAGQGSAAPGTTAGQGSAAPGTAAAGQGSAAPETTTAGQGSAAPGTTAGQGSAAPGTTPVGQGSAAPETTPELLPAALLNRAREAYEAGHFPEALAALDEFRSNFPLGSDEAWWLYGQVLESAGPRRDIRGALEYYRRLIREYPQSPRCDDAGKRIAYLERFYFNIR